MSLQEMPLVGRGRSYDLWTSTPIWRRALALPTRSSRPNCGCGREFLGAIDRSGALELPARPDAGRGYVARRLALIGRRRM